MPGGDEDLAGFGRVEDGVGCDFHVQSTSGSPLFAFVFLKDRVLVSRATRGGFRGDWRGGG